MLWKEDRFWRAWAEISKGSCPYNNELLTKKFFEKVHQRQNPTRPFTRFWNPFRFLTLPNSVRPVINQKSTHSDFYNLMNLNVNLLLECNFKGPTWRRNQAFRTKLLHLVLPPNIGQILAFVIHVHLPFNF